MAEPGPGGEASDHAVQRHFGPKILFVGPLGQEGYRGVTARLILHPSPRLNPEGNTMAED